MTTPSPPLAAPSSSPKTSDEIPQELPAPPTERSTPIKPEDIPGAVRVFPMPMMSSAASGSHWKHRDGRSASVDMNGYGGGSLAGSNAARHSPITLPRATKNFRSQTSHHTSHETATTTTKLTTTSNEELVLPLLLPTSSSRKFQVAINSTTSHQDDLRLQEEKEKKTTLKQSCNITDDSPPTIELIAYKCSDAGDGSGDVAGEGSGGSGGRGSYDETGEGYQISGYEADDDTLNSREMKLFKPSKFVPKLASSASVWKPSTTTTTIGDAKLS